MANAGIAIGGSTNIVELKLSSPNDAKTISIGASILGQITIDGVPLGLFLQNKRIRKKTADYTLTTDDFTVEFEATSSNLTAFLPPSADCYSAIAETGCVFNIKRINSGGKKVTVEAFGSELIDGNNKQPLLQQYNGITVQSNGAGWVLL